MKIYLHLVLVVLSFLGILDASYLSYQRLIGEVPPCNRYFACNTVLESPWSKVGPVPLSVLGLAFYLVFFISSLAFYLGKRSVQVGQSQVSLARIMAVQGLIGGGFSLFLLFLMGVVLKAWCLYCLFSAGICMMLFVLSSVNFFVENLKKEHHES